MTVSSFDPRTGTIHVTAPETTPAQLAATLAGAAQAAPMLAATAPAARRRWLEALADSLDHHQEELAALADRETALGIERLRGEVARTANQLRFYGEVAVEGSYLEVTIDDETGSTPALARVNRPLGPVAVFGASNFPFAFSLLGHDTASALAAGCPVVVKAHSAHLGLTLRQAEIAQAALAAAGAPRGTLGVVVGRDAGIRLVQAPETAAVGFTGSQSGGLALGRLANDREDVIPVYAEMGTVNPAVVTRAGAANLDAVARGFVGSFTLGHGQFCTKPGLLLAPAGVGAADAVAAALRDAVPHPVMLTRAIAESVSAGLEAMLAAGARRVAEVPAAGGGWAAPAAVLAAELSDLRPGSPLLEECFGAVALVCEYADDTALAAAVGMLQPSLAASLFTGSAVDPQAPGLIDLLAAKVGRVAVNQWPTGVAVTWAQQHGGPWPATSVPSATSVGAHGLARFVRPVTFQAARDEWLPPAAQSANPWQVTRRVNGRVEPAAALGPAR